MKVIGVQYYYPIDFMHSDSKEKLIFKRIILSLLNNLKDLLSILNMKLIPMMAQLNFQQPLLWFWIFTT